MRRRLAPVLVLALALTVLAPRVALAADAGSTIFSRFWDSMVNTWKNRTQTEVPGVVQFFQQAEAIFLGDTSDLTAQPAVRDVVAGMRAAGIILLALCFVLSLNELAIASMVQGQANLYDWFRRVFIATTMTLGTIPVYSLIIRLFNHLLATLRHYLDLHWGAGGSTMTIYEQLVQILVTIPGEVLIALGLLAVYLLALLVLWFLVGGIRTAELAIHILLAPLTWPLYMLASLEDIPKAAFRAFLMWSSLPLIVTAMLRLAVRMVQTGHLGQDIWNYIPAVCLVLMTVFIPVAVRRVVGQGYYGMGAVTGAMRLLMGLRLAAAAGAAAGTAAGRAAAPPATNSVPPTAMTPTYGLSYPGSPSPMAAAAAGQMPTWYFPGDPGLGYTRTPPAPPAEPPALMARNDPRQFVIEMQQGSGGGFEAVWCEYVDGMREGFRLTPDSEEVARSMHLFEEPIPLPPPDRGDKEDK